MELNKYLLGYYFDDIEKRLPGFGQSDIDKIKIELDWRIYHYGENFSNPLENRKTPIDISLFLRNIKNKLFFIKNSVQGIQKNGIISSVYFANFYTYLSSLGYTVKSPVWLPMGYAVDGDLSLSGLEKKVSKLLETASFRELLSEKSLKILKNFESDLSNHFIKSDPLALILYTDQYYFSKVALEIFKKIERKSFILSHGVPGIYSKEVDNRADYLLVWGNKTRANYIKNGFNENKIHVIGHPGYSKKDTRLPLRNSLENILVLPKAMYWHQHTLEPIVNDRGVGIVYLLSVQQTLKRLGVKKVLLRSHPSMNINWIMKFLDPDFFIPDMGNSLISSLNKSTLVIGPTSTVFLESIIHGVNYLIYEPQENGVDYTGVEVVPPFDGSDPEIAVAKNEADLYRLLKIHATYDADILSGYIEPFRKEVLKDILNG
ncbi:MAG: hypothetical protein ACOH2A_06770 [Sphingobacteriaceae bacterium]